MFGGLFEDEDSSFSSSIQQAGDTRTAIPRPTSPRSGARLCGLSNLGATCYMNSLLQTMIYTPELREALLSLTEEELGLKGDDTSLVRSIPLQLQILFSRILLLNQNSVGIKGLINSFGWTNNEELQQHDVQELNRILFDALESSLMGTSGQTVVHHLFHGTTVQQIVCSGCGQISEREEDFLDLSLPLSARPGIECSLKEMFCDTEKLDGKNQYRCDICQGLVDAERHCRLKTLPPILTFALLRFLYDYTNGERYKDTSKFQFPLTLNMSPYMVNSGSDKTDSVLYDLYSVVIHGGSTHSGHYIAYIRDIDGLGTWTHPSEEGVTLVSETTDPLEFNSPRELIVAILRQLGGSASINDICKHLQSQTGVTWNKRFKNSYGPIKKFFSKHSDLFILDNTDSNVTLKTTPTSNKMSAVTDKKHDSRTCNNEATPSDDVATPSDKSSDSKSSHKKIDDKSDPPPVGERWYEFNDSSVASILTESINKMFQGKQSAYMLFYRQRNLQRPAEAIDNPSFGVPERLIKEVLLANKALETERKQYDDAINTVSITVHSALCYNQEGGALINIMDDLTHQIKMDRRCSLAELRLAIIEELNKTGLITDAMTVLHIARQIPAGLHLYDCVTKEDEDQRTLLEAGITNNINIFVWDGVKVGGVSLLTGSEHEPINLHLSYPGQQDMVEVSRGFSKSSTLCHIREYFSQFLDCQATDVNIYEVKQSNRSGNASSVLLPNSKDNVSLDDLKLENGGRLAGELKVTGNKRGTFGQSVANKQNNIVTFIVENRCVCSEDYPVYPVEVVKTEKLSQVKHHILTQLNLLNLEGGNRLRVDDDLHGIGPPLCEDQTLIEAGIVQGCRVILEKGTPPLSNEIYLSCSSEFSEIDSCEIVLSRTTTIKNCCELLLPKLGLQGTEWHLRRTNWCGEVGGILDDEDATFEKLRIKSGECLIVENGKLPPKGFVRINVYRHDQYSQVDASNLHDMPGNSDKGKEEDTMETAKEGTSVPLHEQDHTQFYPPPIGTVTRIGTIEINKNSKLEHLKETIVTLPLLANLVIPNTKFLRVREIVNGRSGKIFKQLSATLRQMRLYTGGNVCCQLLSFEEDLLLSEIVFYIQSRIPYTRTYSAPIEVTYDTACSATPIRLRNFVANLIDMSPENTVLAKHKFEKFEWIKIEGKSTGKTDGKTGNRGKKSKGKGSGTSKEGCSNIKNSPISLHDGDIVGVKDLQYDTEDTIDDFMTIADDNGSAILLAIQEEKRKSRKAKATGNNDYSQKRQRRPEIGIKINVPDYSSAVTNSNQLP